tara:strand:+ start:246 stop:689 length:444 start_codon:yes stop_codon:yes gene_type:complete
MKKLNRTETRILASRMLNAEVNRAVEKAENSPQIKSKLANATKLLKEWVKEKHKAKQKEQAFKKFVEDNRVLIEGGFGNIILKYDESWNSSAGDWNRNISIDISSSSEVEERIEEEIVLQQIESETLDELKVNVREAIINNSQKLLT